MKSRRNPWRDGRLPGRRLRRLPFQRLLCGVLVVAALALQAMTAVAQPAVDGPLPTPLPLFPSNNWWNLDITNAPIDPNSGAFINFIGGTRRVHPDMGFEGDDENSTYGIPYIVVSGSQPLVPVTFVEFGNQSDAGAPGRPPGYPIPEQAKTTFGWIEGGPPGNVPPNGDRHMLIVDRDNRILYELYRAHWNAGLNRWEAGSGAIFPLTTNLRRPDGWTSADAAGLAILPGLIRYDEAFGTEPIRHALRVTVQSTNGYVYPASHRAGNRAGALPMGARLRLKANVNINSHPVHVRRVLQAMKTYGLIVADNGSNMFVTGTSDPRWTPVMDDFVGVLHSFTASQFDVIQLGWNPPAEDLGDDDGDGLLNAWERKFGLDPDNPNAENGATGDPDNDGRSNAQEQAAGTHPRGLHRRYFAEGVSNGFFSTRFAYLNTAASPAHVLFQFQRADGQSMSHVLTVDAQSRATLNPASVTGMEGAEYSTVIESDQVPAVDRQVSWNASGYGAHAETALSQPSTTWYLAEGATHGDFDLFYLIQNPGGQPADVTVRYLRPAPRPPLEQTYRVEPRSRFTIYVDTRMFDGQRLLEATDVSAAITSTQPIVVERAMYKNVQGQAFGAGHNSAGVTQAATSWFFAEGATGGFFDLFLLIANPSMSDTANVRVRYLLPNGNALEKTYTIAPSSRFNIGVDHERFNGQPLLAETAVSTIVESVNGVPIVAERSQWWPSPVWQEGHNSPGATSAGPRWALAEGELGGTLGVSTYVLVANTSPFAGSVRATFYPEGGEPIARTYEIRALSRFNISPGSVQELAGRRFGVLVESLGTQPIQIVVERAMYWDALGIFWAAGTNALGTPMP